MSTPEETLCSVHRYWHSRRLGLPREQRAKQGQWQPRHYIRYTRQDIRLVVWLLAAVVIMLGLIADRIH
jgi:hypothetical protein